MHFLSLIQPIFIYTHLVLSCCSGVGGGRGDETWQDGEDAYPGGVWEWGRGWEGGGMDVVLRDGLEFGRNRPEVRTVEVGNPAPAKVGLGNGRWMGFLDAGHGVEMNLNSVESLVHMRSNRLSDSFLWG